MVRLNNFIDSSFEHSAKAPCIVFWAELCNVVNFSHTFYRSCMLANLHCRGDFTLILNEISNGGLLSSLRVRLNVVFNFTSALLIKVFKLLLRNAFSMPFNTFSDRQNGRLFGS
jgi:hypothetical protein